MIEPPETLYATFHGGHLGSTFDDPAKAESYPGPRMWEAAEKHVERYVSASALARLAERLRNLEVYHEDAKSAREWCASMLEGVLRGGGG